MSGNGFGFDKGLLGPTSWAPTNAPAQPARNAVVKEFETASKEGQPQPQQQAPSWPAVAQARPASAGSTAPSTGDLRNYSTSDVIKDSAFADVKSYITGGR